MTETEYRALRRELWFWRALYSLAALAVCGVVAA